MIISPTATHFADHDRPRMNAETHGELHPFVALQARIQGHGDGLDNAQTGMEGTLRIVFVRHRPAEIDEQSVAEILGNIALKLVDDLRSGFLIGADDLAQVFGIELLGEVPLEPGEYAVVEFSLGEANIQVWDFGYWPSGKPEDSKDKSK